MLCCSCRLSRLLPLFPLRRSRPLPAIGPGERPEQQHAEADRIQEEQPAVAGHQRPRQQQLRPDRNRGPLVPPDETGDAGRDRLDP